MKIQYQFSSTLWQYAGKGAWYFVSLPEKLSEEIRENFKSEEEGWGRLRAMAKIGDAEWQTAIWFDAKRNTYLLPIKADIRKKEKLVSGKTIAVRVYI